MDRLEQLKKIFENVEEDKKELISYAIEELVYIENRLKVLKKYPFILFNKLTGETRTTAAAKQFHSLQQTYTNYLKVLNGVLRNASGEEDDAFDAWVKSIIGE